MTIAFGQVIIEKGGRRSLGMQSAISKSETATELERRQDGEGPFVEQGPIEAETVDESFTQAPIDVRENERSLEHRHFGHPDAHPVGMRHRKISSDPSHREEDHLLDEWKDLYDKAKSGSCTPMELRRIRDIRGRLEELNATRIEDARRIIGDQLENPMRGDERVENAGVGAVPPVGGAKAAAGQLATPKWNERADALRPAGDPYAWPKRQMGKNSGLRKSMDAAIMLSSAIINGRDEPPYPADEPEDDGTYGAMPDPADGEVAHDLAGSARNVGPYAGDVKERGGPGIPVEKSRPKGWTKSSSSQYWDKVSKGSHDECVEHVGGNVDDPHAFCAWAEHEGTGHWPGERRKAEKQMPTAGMAPQAPPTPPTVSTRPTILARSQPNSVNVFKDGISTGRRPL